MRVTEKIIEAALSEGDVGIIKVEDFIEKFSSLQRSLWVYLQEELFPILTEKETTYFIFMLFIIYSSIGNAGIELKEISIEAFQKCEESNWEIFNESKTKFFRDPLDTFFENYKEEDLLAFIEDMLTLEDNDEITSIGIVPMFVASKSLVDVFIEA